MVEKLPKSKISAITRAFGATFVVGRDCRAGHVTEKNRISAAKKVIERILRSLKSLASD